MASLYPGTRSRYSIFLSLSLSLSLYVYTYIHIHICVYNIIYIYTYTDITRAQAWLETINRPRRDVIAIFGRLIGSLLESRGSTWRRRNRTSVSPLSDQQSKLCPLKRKFRGSGGKSDETPRPPSTSLLAASISERALWLRPRSRTMNVNDRGTFGGVEGIEIYLPPCGRSRVLLSKTFRGIVSGFRVQFSRWLYRTNPSPGVVSSMKK